MPASKITHKAAKKTVKRAVAHKRAAPKDDGSKLERQEIEAFFASHPDATAESMAAMLPAEWRQSFTTRVAYENAQEQAKKLAAV